MNTNMISIIFSEMYNNSLDALTHDRNMAAIPFGGRYRLVDFVLSNMVNSGITTVGVLAKQHYHSLMDHLSNSQEWDLNRKNGGLMIIPPAANEDLTQVHRGKLDELRNALDYLRNSTADYVMLADAHMVYNMDYRPVLKDHIASGCDVTVVATQKDGTATDVRTVVMQMRPDHRAASFLLDYVPKAGDYASMGVFIMNRQYLINVVQEYTAQGIYHLERDLFQREFNKGRLNVNIFPFQGVALHMRTLQDVFKSNLALTDPAVGASLFRPDAPIYTRVNDEVPAYYGPDCRIADCVIADGCIIEGQADHCVLSRGVRVGKGASIKSCIVMQGSVIGENAVLENVIVDKWASISAGSELKGTPSSPVVIRKGATV